MRQRRGLSVVGSGEQALWLHWMCSTVTIDQFDEHQGALKPSVNLLQFLQKNETTKTALILMLSLDQFEPILVVFYHSFGFLS